MTTRAWQHFKHAANIGARGMADTLKQAFVKVALVMPAVITAADKVTDNYALSRECHAPDNELGRHAATKPWRGRQVVDKLAERDIIIRCPRQRGVAEEAPGACKDVSAVVDSADFSVLVRKVARLEPLVYVKGEFDYNVRFSTSVCA